MSIPAVGNLLDASCATYVQVVTTTSADPAASSSSSGVAPSKSESKSKAAGSQWGRAEAVSWANSLACIFLLAATPTSAFWTYAACAHYKCALSGPIYDEHLTWDKVFPAPTLKGALVYVGWLVFQGLLYAFLPGKIGYGQRTPAGYLLPYKVNGLFAWTITHVAFVFGSFYLGIFPASIIADLWGPLLIAANAYGYILSIFSYVKAWYFPSHPEDCKFSGSIPCDIFMGIEFNPRFGEMWDFKQFHNGRPGIIAWTLIDISFAAAQYNEYGYVTNSMILLNILHMIYVVDFFYNEDWYLRTIDIAHDHFGFYLGWGDIVWLPWMYTLQAHYLLRNPISLSTAWFAFLLGMGLLGYGILRSANHQKDVVRRTDGQCAVWGKPARVIRTKYTTGDGEVHTSLLLASGFWGLAHQFNYVGDLLLSTAECLLCGAAHPLPYFYIAWMTALLLHRISRSEKRCQAKYGKYWDEYNKIVPWKLCPYVY
ncbi:hypothetical protein BOTBODRAFT_125802 [Botryobasidium botryosum FD-172 SS1]|uniref:7-dehydrocholesterol reductase n=1 Tax=Botryobasidium botryosum (strain FD-172 SS1) TaxID=930990 RepID=A0A067N7Y7_BOTB1|nr:hypothetical protein BOTBODRAFT_125802 [Botryobasidium botryosum FD-172 SS1]